MTAVVPTSTAEPFAQAAHLVREVRLAGARALDDARGHPDEFFTFTDTGGTHAAAYIEMRAMREAHDVAARTGAFAADADSTHVSLLPPPCDEFTTSEPLRIAPRVSPPGST